MSGWLGRGLEEQKQYVIAFISCPFIYCFLDVFNEVVGCNTTVLNLNCYYYVLFYVNPKYVYTLFVGRFVRAPEIQAFVVVSLTLILSGWRIF